MAKRSPQTEPQRAVLTVDQMKSGIRRLQKRIDDLRAFNPQSVQKRWAPEVKTLETAIDETLTAIFGHDTVEHRRYEGAARLDHGPHIMNHRPPPSEVQQYLYEGKEKALLLLRQAVRGLEEEIAEQEHEASSAPATHTIAPALLPSKVFVVHGHDEAVLHAAARFLEQLKLEAIILREQPDAGRTVIEKFEDCASEVGFAIVLLTPDDLAGPVPAPAPASRARQNVIFELGYFAGKLGRGRVCLLRKGEVEIPSDLHGVIYSDMDAADGWKLKLVRELKAAGLDFDTTRVWT